MTATFDVAGVSIPKLGIGTFGLQDEECARVVAAGLAGGYRHVDTAQMYANEAAVGEGVRASGLAREEVFVTSKVWKDQLRDGVLQAAAEASLRRLGFDQLDLYLIHWPSPQVPVHEAVKALCEVQRRGLARAVGVSNFPVALIEEAVAAADVPLAVDQVEYHPYLDQSKVLAALRRHGMGLTAYCPLARGAVAHEPAIVAIAERHGVSPATVALAWLLAQPSVIAIPKSARPERLRENLGALDVRLSEEERAAIDALKRPDGRLVDPEGAPTWDS